MAELGLDSHITSEALADLLSDTETKPNTLSINVRTSLKSSKKLEKLTLIFLRDTNTRVLDSHCQIRHILHRVVSFCRQNVVLELCEDLNGASNVGELKRIRKQVEDALLQPLLVCKHVIRARYEVPEDLSHTDVLALTLESQYLA